MNIFKLIKPLSAEGVFETWRNIEEPLEHWKSVWRSKEFGSWNEWRKATHAALFQNKLDWHLYEIADPEISVPEWRGGMFHSWNKWFYNSFSEQPPRLKDLIIHPGVANHWYIREIANNFPDQTTITAVRLPNNDILVVEGMHRCCALTMNANNKDFIKSKISVILADWPNDNIPLLGTGWEK